MAKLILDHYRGQDIYSDGDIEEYMLSLVRKEESFEKIIEDDPQWPVIYHFSHDRENILNWYPFGEGKSILEIGAGCGALTGLLCDKGCTVTAVELSKRRAEICFERHKHRDHLNIIVGDIFDLAFETQFDYITLIGVLEYAGLTRDSGNPYVDLLKYAGRFLKSGGKLLIGIENRFGIKYFSGAPEDHTSKFFDGIQGYKNKNVQTFNKYELDNILGLSGFTCSNYFYPFPDYKFPRVIFTDKSYDLIGNELRSNYSLDQKRFSFFDDVTVLKQLADMDIASFFSNSFLVECGFAPSVNELLYARVNSDRRPEFRTITTICEGKEKKYSVKTALNPSAQPHIEKMADARSHGRFHYVDSYLDHGRLISDYISSPLVIQNIAGFIAGNDMDGLYGILGMFFEALKEGATVLDYDNAGFRDIFGDIVDSHMELCHSPANIDLTFTNLFMSGDRFIAIDTEWIFDFAIPIRFIFYRAVHELYVRRLPLKISLDQVLSRFGFLECDIDMYHAWEVHFINKYVYSYKPVTRFCKPPINVTLEQCASYPEQTIRMNSLEKAIAEKDSVIAEKELLLSQNEKNFQALRQTRSYRMARHLSDLYGLVRKYLHKLFA